MKYIVLVLIASSCFSATMSQPARPRTSLVGVFDGRTPCQDLAAQLDEKIRPECIKIKWRLTLYQDSLTGNPTTYSLLGFVYKKEDPRTGAWHITKGTKTNPEAIVYQLDQPGRKSLFLQKGDDNVLFFLDDEKRLLVGNRDFGYTLNRKP